jgi:hypothetical protein
MADADVRAPGRGSGGTNLILILLVVVVLGLVTWLVLNRGEASDIEVNTPTVETPDVEVKGSN